MARQDVLVRACVIINIIVVKLKKERNKSLIVHKLKILPIGKLTRITFDGKVINSYLSIM